MLHLLTEKHTLTLQFSAGTSLQTRGEVCTITGINIQSSGIRTKVKDPKNMIRGEDEEGRAQFIMHTDKKTIQDLVGRIETKCTSDLKGVTFTIN